MDIVKDGIPEIYSNCGVMRFPFYPKPDITVIEDDPFFSGKPFVDKLYQFHPNPHEDCVSKRECRHNLELCELLDKSRQFCPYYGVYIVSSTNIEDKPYTLSGEPAQNRNEIIADLNTEDGHYVTVANSTDSGLPVTDSGLPVTEFWRNKIIRHWGTFISPDTPPLIKTKIERYRDKILSLYEKMTRLIDPYRPISEQIEMDEDLPEIKLSEIITIFCDGMGYDKIHIIDPSCNVCEIISKLKFAAQLTASKIRNSEDNTLTKKARRGGGKKMTKKRKLRTRKTRKMKLSKKRQ